MKINDISPSKYVKEGMVEPNVLLSIRNVCVRGKATNTFEFMMMARLLQMLKDGCFFTEYNPFESNMSTDKETLDTLRAMPDEIIAKIATKLWDLLQIKDQSKFAGYAAPSGDYLQWVLSFATAKEATD